MRPRRSFPDKWFSSGVNPDKLSPHAVRSDRWDREDFARMSQEAAELAAAGKQLANAAPTGAPLMEDLWHSLHKAAPVVQEPDAMRPDHLINRSVMEEAFDLAEWRSVRSYTVGDDVASSIAAASLEPDIEALLDRQELLRHEAEKLQQMMADLAAARAEKQDLDEMIERWTSPDADPEEAEQGMQEIAGQEEGLDGLIEQLAEDAEKQGETLVEAMAQAAPSVRASMARAFERAAEAARQMAGMSRTWGLEQGQLQRMPADERLALARKLNTPRMKRIAELFGPMRNLAMTEQMRKTTHAVDEIVAVTVGSNLERVLPSEFVKLNDPVRRIEFFRDFAEGRLPEWQLEGVEKVGKGGIILCKDCSGSMSGEPDMWATAVMLCLLHIARQQKRAFTLIDFSGPGQTHIVDFRTPADYTVDKILEAAEVYFGGGTCFSTPINRAIELLRTEHAEKGFVEGDIVFVSDGLAGVSEQWMTWFQEEKSRLRFSLWGILIGMKKDVEPIYTLADHHTCDVKDLVTGGDIRDLFRGV